ncbi:MAG: metallophosphoesterase [Christensenellaceae bacterium]|nr:metallophosphoesterase [Christensenellaceae bacterium]
MNEIIKPREEKRILVLSDSHRDLFAAKKVLEIEQNIDEIWHLGDMASDCEDIAALRALPFRAVRGNCDYYDQEYLSEIVVTILGHKFLLVHGHKHSVKTTLLRLKLAAMEEGASAVLFGHTHMTFLTYEDGILFMNPGSISEPCGIVKNTYGIIRVNREGIFPEIRTL